MRRRVLIATLDTLLAQSIKRRVVSAALAATIPLPAEPVEIVKGGRRTTTKPSQPQRSRRATPLAEPHAMPSQWSNWPTGTDSPGSETDEPMMAATPRWTNRATLARQS